MNELIIAWRERADELERYAPNVAISLRECATELDAALRRDAADTVSLKEGALLSGYSADHLGKLILSGHLPNYGNKKRPRVRIVDLPKKPGHKNAPLDMSLLALHAVRKKA